MFMFNAVNSTESNIAELRLLWNQLDQQQVLLDKAVKDLDALPTEQTKSMRIQATRIGENLSFNRFKIKQACIAGGIDFSLIHIDA